MGNFCQQIGTLVETCDFFSAPILLRYDTDDKKSSKAGGFLSLALIILLIIAFYRSWINVFEKQDVQSDTILVR